MKSKTLAVRRHHETILKHRRKHYHNAIAGTEKAFGLCFQTPCGCSCWMCGNQRQHHGMNRQEIRARARYTD